MLSLRLCLSNLDLSSFYRRIIASIDDVVKDTADTRFSHLASLRIKLGTEALYDSIYKANFLRFTSCCLYSGSILNSDILELNTICSRIYNRDLSVIIEVYDCCKCRLKL